MTASSAVTNEISIKTSGFVKNTNWTKIRIRITFTQI